MYTSMEVNDLLREYMCVWPYALNMGFCKSQLSMVPELGQEAWNLQACLYFHMLIFKMWISKFLFVMFLYSVQPERSHVSTFFLITPVFIRQYQVSTYMQSTVLRHYRRSKDTYYFYQGT